MGAVDVFQSTRLEAIGEAVVFFARYVAVGLVEQFDGAVQAAGPIEMRVNGHVIIDVLAVIDRSVLDLKDGGIDFLDGFAFLLAAFATVGTFEVGARIAQIGQSMQVSGGLPPRCAWGSGSL